MPIVSSSLDPARPQRDGTVRVYERHTDSKGRNWPLAYRHTVTSDPIALQTYLDAAAVVHNANQRHYAAQKRFNEAKRKGDQAAMDAAAADMAVALADVQVANADLQVSYDALAVVATTEVTTIMAARDFTDQLQDKEESDAIEFIEAGGDPGAFIKVDLSNTQYNRRIAKKFANSHTHLDRQFVCNVASWVAGFTAVQIANALSVPEAKGTEILNRAIVLRDDVCPALVADDGKVEDI